MILFAISIAKTEILKSRLKKLGINPKDLKEDFIKGSGPGGQKINKTSSCVYLLHIPSGTEIKCQKTRSQNLNRYYARILLCEKLEERLVDEKSKKQKEIEKIKRQKRKRSKRAKDKILQNKKKISEKKALRVKVSS